ncbi:MAG: hypoxanthine-guanine phosphoribosyltransferase, partial [Pseudomonadota bacterium]
MSAITAQQAWQVLQQADLLHAPRDVDAAIERLAKAIEADLADRDPMLVCVMTGGVVPFGLLLPRLTFPFQIDYVHATR